MKGLHILLFCLLLGSTFALQPNEAQKAKNIFFNLYGGVVSDARVMTTSNGETYLLGSWAPNHTTTPHLRLLRSFAGSFIEVWAKQDFYGLLEDKDVLDLNQDGLPEVYWKVNSFGNTVGEVEFTLYDTRSGQEINATLYYAHGSKSNDLTVDPTLADHPSFLSFLEKKIAADEHFAVADARRPDPRSPENAITLWRAAYSGFSEQSVNQVNLTPRYYSLTEDSIANSTSKVTFTHEGLRFVSVFKDAVYAIDDTRKRYFVVFSPDTTYDWVTDITPLGPCISMTTNSVDYNVAYYNVKTRELSWSPELACAH